MIKMTYIRKTVIILLCLLMLLASVSCGSDTKTSSPGVTAASQSAADPQSGSADNTSSKSTGKFDYDFTKMGQSVAYSQLVDFMNEPTKYMGKTIKIKGDYYAQPSDDGKTTYYWIILNDTTACCSAYIEFLSDSGNYPAKSSDPNSGDIVTITASGVIDSYDELGQTYYILRADSIA